MESVIEYLQRKLKEAGASSWPAIVEATGVSKWLPRKLAYGDRKNPGLAKVQPLVDYFKAQDALNPKRRAADKAI